MKIANKKKKIDVLDVPSVGLNEPLKTVAKEISTNDSDMTKNWLIFGGGILVFVSMVLFTGYLGWRYLGSDGKKEEPKSAQPSPVAQITVTVTQKILNRKEINIQVLNASGVRGAAAVLAEKIKGLGYEQITVGNASLVRGDGLNVFVTKDLLDEKAQIESDFGGISKIERIEVSDSGEKTVKIMVVAE